MKPPTSMKHVRSEEHTSELQSHLNLVCRLLLVKKMHKSEDIDNIIAAAELGDEILPRPARHTDTPPQHPAECPPVLLLIFTRFFFFFKKTGPPRRPPLLPPRLPFLA